MGEINLVEWPPARNFYLKAIFDTITKESGLPDVDFQVGTRIFKVHKKVLEKYSSVLKAQLSDVWKTSGDVLHVDEEYVEPEVVEELLKWMYYSNAGEDLKCSTENAYSLCIAADYLMIPKLVTSCCGELSCQIGPDNIYEIYTFSKNLNLDSLRQDCESCVSNRPSIFLMSPQVGKWKAEELEMFIQKSLKFDDSIKVRETILLSLVMWTKPRFDDRIRKSENFLEFVPPDTVSSDTLFRFMQTELYSKLDESHRKQYYVRSYLPTGVSSTDKLYCVSSTDTNHSLTINLHCLDLSDDQKWFDSSKERFIFSSNDIHPSSYLPSWLMSRRSEELRITAPVLAFSWGKNIYFIGHVSIDSWAHRYIKVFSTETGEWINSEVTKPLNGYDHQMLAGAVLNDYIYIPGRGRLFQNGKSFSRYCLMTNQWQVEPLEVMQTDRMSHQLVTLNGFLYAIGGEVAGQDRRPERYDPQVNRWEYIGRLNYYHRIPTAVAHEGQIYVLSWAGFERYSPNNDRWSKLPVPDVCHRPSLVSIAGGLWLLTDSFYFPMTSRLVYEFDVVDRKWTRLPDLPKGYYTDFSIVIQQ